MRCTHTLHVCVSIASVYTACICAYRLTDASGDEDSSIAGGTSDLHMPPEISHTHARTHTRTHARTHTHTHVQMALTIWHVQAKPHLHLIPPSLSRLPTLPPAAPCCRASWRNACGDQRTAGTCTNGQVSRRPESLLHHDARARKRLQINIQISMVKTSTTQSSQVCGEKPERN